MATKGTSARQIDMDGQKDLRSGSSGHRKSYSRRKERKLDSGYYRVLGIRDKDTIAQNNKKYENVAAAPKPSGILHIFSGEKKEDRHMRLKMNQYKQLLQADLKVAEKSSTYHLSRQDDLQQEFKEQEMQLWRWGLEHLIQDFRMQAWLREDRGELLVKMSSIIVSVIQERLRQIHFTLGALSTKPAMRLPREKESLGAADDSFYVSPEKLLEGNVEYVTRRARLNHFDKLCHAASVKFRELLPELNSKTYGERESALHDICARYSHLLDDHFLSINVETVSQAAWPDFCEWYAEKCRSEIDIYADFLRFVDDEREREGRLFRRWCSLLKSLTDPAIFRMNSGVTSLDASSHELSPSNDASRGPPSLARNTSRTSSATGEGTASNGSGRRTNHMSVETASSSVRSTSTPGADGGTAAVGDKKAMEANAKYLSHPKAVQTFIRYFALNILSQYYSVPPHLQSTLVALTDVVIHRNVFDALFVYPTQAMKKQDRIWRLKSKMCRYIDPVEYAVEPKFLGRGKRVVATAGMDRGYAPATAVATSTAQADLLNGALEEDSSYQQEGDVGDGAVSSTQKRCCSGAIDAQGGGKTHVDCISTPIPVATSTRRPSALAEQIRLSEKALPEGHHSLESVWATPSRQIPSDSDIPADPHISTFSLPTPVDDAVLLSAVGNDGTVDSSISSTPKTPHAASQPLSQAQRRRIQDVTLFRASLEAGSDSVDLLGDATDRLIAIGDLTPDRDLSGDDINVDICRGIGGSRDSPNRDADRDKMVSNHRRGSRSESSSNTPPPHSSTLQEQHSTSTSGKTSFTYAPVLAGVSGTVSDGSAGRKGEESNDSTSSSRRRRRSARYSKDAVCDTLLRNVAHIGSLRSRLRDILGRDYSAAVEAKIEDTGFTTATLPRSLSKGVDDPIDRSDTSLLSGMHNDTGGGGATVATAQQLLVSTSTPYSPSAIEPMIASPPTKGSHGSSTSIEVSDSAYSVPPPPQHELPIAPYAKSSRLLGLVNIAMCPRDVIGIILMAMIWLIRTTTDISGKVEALGADSVFPIIVNVLINADIPNVHLVLHYITTYASVESFGEAAYYITCLNAAVQFIDQMDVPTDIQSKLCTDFQLLSVEGGVSSDDDTSVDDMADDDVRDFDSLQTEALLMRSARTASEVEDRTRALTMERKEKRDKAIGDKAVQHLGEWLRDQQVMEDTMVVMMQEGWMG